MTGKGAAPDLFFRPSAAGITLLLLIAMLVTGLGAIALTPIFAGQDEIMHYSRIEAAAFAPKQGRADFIAADADSCAHLGPMPAGWILFVAANAGGKINKGGALQDAVVKSGHLDYGGFFAASPKRQEEFVARCQEAPGTAVFTPTADQNMEYQHPPLYYLLLGGALKLAPGLSLAGRQLYLRTLSLLLAFAGFALGLLATQRHFSLQGVKNGDDIIAFGAFLPFLMPAFFREFARLGNDALCLFLFGVMWALVLVYLRRPREPAIWVGIGLAAGYAWLTKLTMLPVTLGLMLFMICFPPPAGTGASEPLARRLLHRLLPGVAALLAAIVVGHAPYGGNATNVHGSVEISAWLHDKSFAAGGIPWTNIFHALMHLLTATVCDLVHVLPAAGLRLDNGSLPLLFAPLAAAWLISLRKASPREEFLPLFALLPLAGGLCLYAVLASIALHETASAAGYYIHIAAPALALALGLGARRLALERSGRIYLSLLLPLCLAGGLAIQAAQLAVFGGCLRENLGDFSLRFDDACHLPALYGHLGLLAWPSLGFTLLLQGFVLASTAALLTLHSLWKPAVLLTSETKAA
jgi:hypothetical protein